MAEALAVDSEELSLVEEVVDMAMDMIAEDTVDITIMDLELKLTFTFQDKVEDMDMDMVMDMVMEEVMVVDTAMVVDMEEVTEVAVDPIFLLEDKVKIIPILSITVMAQEDMDTEVQVVEELY